MLTLPSRFLLFGDVFPTKKNAITLFVYLPILLARNERTCTRTTRVQNDPLKIFIYLDNLYLFFPFLLSPSFPFLPFQSFASPSAPQCVLFCALPYVASGPHPGVFGIRLSFPAKKNCLFIRSHAIQWNPANPVTSGRQISGRYAY